MVKRSEKQDAGGVGLPDLEAIDWASFEHAYGPADDVPEMLRDMLDPARSEQAFARFDAAVNHQGWATPAAAPCMPWLVAALDHPAVPLARLIKLLGDLAIGGEINNWLGQRLACAGPAELVEPVLAVKEAIVGALGHADMSVRAAAAYALAALPGAAEMSLPALRERAAAERKQPARSSVLLAIGILGTAQDVALVEGVLAKRQARGVIVAARCARVWLAPDAISDEDLLELLSEARGKRKVKGLPWAEGDLAYLAEQVSSWAIEHHLPSERLLGLVEQVDDNMAKQMARSLLAQAFPEVGPPLDPSTLTGLQRSALMLAAKTGTVLGGNLAAMGMSRTERGLRIFLGLEEPGMLDRSINGEPLWRLLSAATRGEIEAKDLAVDVAGSLGSDELLAAIFELFDEVHHKRDIVPPGGRTSRVHEDAPLEPRGDARTTLVLAELLRPHGEGARRAAEERLERILEGQKTRTMKLALWLLVLARLGPLDERWDPLVIKGLEAPPAKRDPVALGEVLQAVPVTRREAVVLTAPLVSWTGSTMSNDDEVVFTWRAARGGEGWWHLPSCPTRGVVEAALAALRTWSDLPPIPEPPRGISTAPHAPFPLARIRELFAACDARMVRDALEPLVGDAKVNQELVSTLLAGVAG